MQKWKTTRWLHSFSHGETPSTRPYLPAGSRGTYRENMLTMVCRKVAEIAGRASKENEKQTRKKTFSSRIGRKLLRKLSFVFCWVLGGVIWEVGCYWYCRRELNFDMPCSCSSIRCPRRRRLLSGAYFPRLLCLCKCAWHSARHRWPNGKFGTWSLLGCCVVSFCFIKFDM